MSNVRFVFDLMDNVDIIPLELPGKVVSQCVDSLGVQYKVRYIRESEVCFEYFYSYELKGCE